MRIVVFITEFAQLGHRIDDNIYRFCMWHGYIKMFVTHNKG